MSAAAELRDELLQGLAYYDHWEKEAAREEERQRQDFIRLEVEHNGYAELAYNGKLIELGKLVATQHMTQHMHGWLELHVLPKLEAAEAEHERLSNEVRDWRNAHGSVVAAKRRLSAKYGAIVSQQPRARYRRARKRIKRCVTKITHKLRKMR